MTEEIKTDEFAAEQPRRIEISPIAMLNEARAENEFRQQQSLRNANDIMILLQQRDELQKKIADMSTEYEAEVKRLTDERDYLLGRLAEANNKIVEIQAGSLSALATDEVKENG